MCSATSISRARIEQGVQKRVKDNTEWHFRPPVYDAKGKVMSDSVKIFAGSVPVLFNGVDEREAHPQQPTDVHGVACVDTSVEHRAAH